MGFDNAHRPVAFNSPGGTPRTRPQSDHRLADCKICWEGIYASESRIWANRILPSRATGLVHCSCAERTGAQTSGQPTTGGQRKYRTGK